MGSRVRPHSQDYDGSATLWQPATNFTRDRYSGWPVLLQGAVCRLRNDRRARPRRRAGPPSWSVAGKTHPAIISRSPALDHVIPGSRGGDWLAQDNLVTACWPCNVLKADFHLEDIGWSLRPVVSGSWDDLPRSTPTKQRQDPRRHTRCQTAEAKRETDAQEAPTTLTDVSRSPHTRSTGLTDTRDGGAAGS